MQPIPSTAGSVSLRQALTDGQFFAARDIHVTSCCTDPRSCRPGDLFVATVRDDGDTHELAAEAVRRGAAAILAERLLPAGVPVCVVPDSRVALGRICQALAGNPCRDVNVIGVSGTNGKTTTSVLIASVLRAAGHQVGCTTSLDRCDGFDSFPATTTTPAPPELAAWLARMGSNGCSHGVIEVSSRGLAHQRLSGVDLQAAVLTNVRRAHLDYHGSVANYRRAKAKLFEYLRPQGFAVLNADDMVCQSLLNRLSCPVITVGMQRPAELSATVIERYRGEQTFLMAAGNDTVPVRTRMIGDHHVSNCLAAAAVGLVMGVDLMSIARGLEAVKQLPARLERIECGQEFGVYVDCADTPDRLAMSLRTLRQVTSGRILCVFAADDCESEGERPLVGRVVERSADLGVITSSRPRGAQPLDIAHEILDGYEKPSRAHLIPTRTEAIRWTLGEALPGDSVLITGGTKASACCGQDNRGSDADVARSCLYEVAQGGRVLGVVG